MIKNKSSKMSSESGVGLVEAMLTFVVLAFLLTAIIGWQNTNSWTIANANSREIATYKAQRILDSLQAEGIYNLNPTDSVDCHDVNVGGKKESREFGCKWASRSLDSIPSLANSSEFMVISKEVTVTVDWKIKGTPHTIQVTGAVQ
ncbi:hypothetical protein OAA91_02165 [Fibrobacterales bacterium]|nr:hypothetical protein [Fibrobacterales bacterium]